MAFAKKLIASAVLGFAAFGASSVSATVLTFDDVGQGQLSNYGGLTFSNMWVTQKDAYGESGYKHGAVSGEYVAFNGYATAATFSSATAFSLQSVMLTKAWNAGYTKFDGYVGGALTYSMNVYTPTTSPTLVNFNWTNLNSVRMSDGNGTMQSAIDNLTINAVPEPASGAMILGGLALMGLIGRRRSRAAK